MNINCQQFREMLSRYFSMLMSSEKLDMREQMTEHRKVCPSCEEEYERAYKEHKRNEQAPMLRSILPPRLSPEEEQTARAKMKASLDDIRRMLEG